MTQVAVPPGPFTAVWTIKDGVRMFPVIAFVVYGDWTVAALVEKDGRLDYLDGEDCYLSRTAAERAAEAQHG